MSRQYELSHPWITFQLDLKDLDYEIWMLIGEAISKCQHIAGVPLQPGLAQQLNEIYLSKSAHATTQIEGNTLSEEEVHRRVRHELELPPSQEYLGQEIDNIVAAYNLIIDDVAYGRSLAITPDRIKDFNRLVLHNLPQKDHVIPGKIRKTSVVVGNVYRGAPAEDCEYLIERFCQWLDDLHCKTPPQLKKPVALLSAIMAHLYFAWIHPFGDGNGRTARLIEFQLLIRAGAPTVAAHVLSDFYNRTRSEYYRVLQLTSTSPYPVSSFIKYALHGFVDELREQITKIRNAQLAVVWQNYVNEQFREENTQARIRQRLLVLSLPPGHFTPMNKIRELTPHLAVLYVNKGPKTVSRDINALEKKNLIVRRRTGIMPNIALMEAFMPLIADPDADSQGDQDLSSAD
ncbi:Fic family protein [Actinomadura kijaniata]|uniref:Fic family protein n=1 Tax=Actinomadura kijaniata TaxID=46161 RepID=UPI003F1E0B61